MGDDAEEYAAPLRAKPVDLIRPRRCWASCADLEGETGDGIPPSRSHRARAGRCQSAGHIGGENPARWRGHLDHLLSKRQKLSRGHHAALPYDGSPCLRSSACGSAKPSPRRRSNFLILTAARTGEVLGAKWSEIDIKAKVWIIPNERMKSRTRASSSARRARHRDHARDGGGPNRRPRFPRPKARASVVEHGDGNALAADERRRRDGSWLPLGVPRLGGRQDNIPAGSGRSCARPRCRKRD